MEGENKLDIPFFDYSEIEEYYGKHYAKARKISCAAHYKLLRILTEEQQKIFSMYTNAQMIIDMLGECYYYTKGFEAGKEAQLSTRAVPNMGLVEGISEMLDLELLELLDWGSQGEAD